MEIIERVKELAANYLEKNGIELIDVIYRREQGGMTLRLLVDTPQGISIAECEALNTYLGELLDKENVIEDHYLLEISSPGLDRPLISDKDFERVVGKDIYVSTYEPIESRREHEGKLIGINKDDIVVVSNGMSTVIPRQKIAKAKLKIEF
jgi:ribosome maturation factor RimP